MSSSNLENLAGGIVAISRVSIAGQVKRIGSDEILLIAKEQGNSLHEISKRKAN